MNNLYKEIDSFCDNENNRNQESSIRQTESVQRTFTENQKKTSGNMRLENEGKTELNQNASNQNNENTECKEGLFAQLYNQFSELDQDNCYRNIYGDDGKNNDDDDVLPPSEISNIQNIETNREVYNRARIQDNENDSKANNHKMVIPESTNLISCQIPIEFHKKF